MMSSRPSNHTLQVDSDILVTLPMYLLHCLSAPTLLFDIRVRSGTTPRSNTDRLTHVNLVPTISVEVEERRVGGGGLLGCSFRHMSADDAFHRQGKHELGNQEMTFAALATIKDSEGSSIMPA